MKLFGIFICFNTLHEGLSSGQLGVDFLLLTICQVFNGGKFVLNTLLYGCELIKIHLQFTIVEMTLFHWITNGPKLLQFILIFFLGCSLTSIVQPLNHNVDLFQESFSLGLGQVFFKGAVGVQVGPHFV